MRRVLAIILKDLLQMLRDWKTAFFLLIMPIVFTLMFGFAFQGSGESGESRLPVAYYAADEGLVGRALQAELAESPLLELEEVAGAAAVEEGVASGTYAAGVVVPPAVAGQRVAPTLYVLPGNSGGLAARAEIDSAARRVSSAVETAERATALYAERHPSGADTDRQEFFDETLSAAQAAWDSPPVELAVTPVGSAGQEAEVDEGGYGHASPAMMAQFAIGGLIGAAGILVMERKSRALHRLLTTTVSRAELLLGHFLAMFVIILVQILLLMGFGQLILKLPYFAEPVASLLLAGATAFFAAALGLLIGTLARTEEQVIIFSLLPMFVLAALGGAWFPLELMPSGYQRIAMWTPLARVVEGYKDILVRGLGIDAIVTGVLILLGYAALCLAIAVMRFRTEAR